MELYIINDVTPDLMVDMVYVMSKDERKDILQLLNDIRAPLLFDIGYDTETVKSILSNTYTTYLTIAGNSARFITVSTNIEYLLQLRTVAKALNTKFTNKYAIVSNLNLEIKRTVNTAYTTHKCAA